MNAMATLTMSCSPADTQWTLMATRSTSITELQIVRLPWLGPACALCSNGWTPMEVASVASERRICETAGGFSVHLWLSAPSPQPRLHHQTAHISGLLRLWAGIRSARCGCSHAIQYLSPRRLERNLYSTPGKPRFDSFPMSPPSSLVSYLAQTHNSGPVILLVLTVSSEPRALSSSSHS